jgi:hypothetical protein
MWSRVVPYREAANAMSAIVRNRDSRYIVQGYAHVWPRAVFDIRRTNRMLEGEVRLALKSPGVYVLYRDDEPYYVGKTRRALFDRLWNHANQPGDRYYNFWNFFSVFAVAGKKHRDEVEGILIAAMPTANSASPVFPRILLPARVGRLLQEQRVISIGRLEVQALSKSKRQP